MDLQDQTADEGRPAGLPVESEEQVERKPRIGAFFSSLKAFGAAPFFFFGLGIYRAWIELVYVKPVIETPAFQVAGHDVYDISMVAILLLCALLAKRIIPLFKKRSLVWACVLLMTGGTLLSSLSSLFPSLGTTTPACVAAVSAGLGTGLVILFWSELYGCLNPLRVAFFYSGSLLFSALIIFLFKGLKEDYYFVGLLLLPLLSLLFLYRSYAHIEQENLPKKTWGSFSFPWKPTVLMAVYGFAYGIQETQLYNFSGPHSSLGAVIASMVVFLGIMFIPSRFNVAIIYRVALPLMVCGFLLAPTFSFLSGEVTNVCVAMSFTSFSILTMLILSNITYRFGVGAVWLFGIERGLRAFLMFVGRQTSNWLSEGIQGGLIEQAVPNVIVVAMVVVATVVLLSEKELASTWGITLLNSYQDGGAALIQQALAKTCTRISKEYGLSLREEEVLLLLARHQSLALIEKELFIANGTVKAHIRHIYGKLGIHTRKELLEKLGVSPP
ncbi:MAG: LuxR C-terminal-related transcriptional regulator [Coriobacteriaceae bacterium]|jgi:DNA-binding CsgD family transcriptional regulator|nr:LuxR C-terminal-related transcriptional regulator [Coriobacteriaceae bacterium]